MTSYSIAYLSFINFIFVFVSERRYQTYDFYIKGVAFFLYICRYVFKMAVMI